MKKQLFKARPTFQIEATEEPLIARAGLVLPYEMAKAPKLPQIIDQELPPAGSGHGYRPSQFVRPLILMLHGGGKTLEDLREIKGEISLRKLMAMEGMPAFPGNEAVKFTGMVANCNHRHGQMETLPDSRKGRISLPDTNT